MIKRLNLMITGTSSGIGLGLAKEFLKKGNKVWGCSRREKKINHKNYFHTKIDLNNEKKTKSWILKVKKQSKKKIDIFISSAAQFNRKFHTLDTHKSINTTVRVNLIAPMIISNLISKAMIKERNGLIIFFSSVAVDLNEPGSSTYSSTKSGIEAFSKVLNKELKLFNVKVATLRILYVPTRLSNKLSKKEIKNLLMKYKTNKFKNIKKIINKISEIYHYKKPLNQNIFLDKKKAKLII